MNRRIFLRDSALILLLTAVLIWPIFRVEYLDYWGSIDSTFIADARMLGENLPPVRGFERQLEQVVINLIQNALQALPDKSHGVKVSTLMAPDNKHVQIRVHDNGKGLPAGSVDRRGTAAIPRRRSTDPIPRRRTDDLPFLASEGKKK